MRVRVATRSMLLCLFVIPCYSQDIRKELREIFSVSVSNPLKKSRENVLVVISAEEIQKQISGFNPNGFVVLDNGNEIPSQYNTQNSDLPGIVTVLPTIKEGEKRSLTILYKKQGELKRTYTKRTQAELSHKIDGKFVNREYIGGTFKNVNALRVPPEHKDHSWFIRYEGPGWESDIVGYRLYLDQRNATDVFGKKTTDMTLQQVGLDGFDSYHEMQPWGMDVMKVGKSLGLGSLGAWRNKVAIRVEKTDSVNCRIAENGNVYSSIITNYFGWKTGEEKSNVRSEISIHAGTRLTRHTVSLTPQIDSLCTGIVKDKVAKIFTSPGDNANFGYIATYGKQSLNSDELGLAVFFDPQNSLGFSVDEFSNVIRLKSSKGRLSYYFLASWIQEPGGFRDEAEFMNHIKQVAQELGHPLKIKIEKQ